MSGELGTSKYNGAVRRYRQPKLTTSVDQSDNNYTVGTYLGFDAEIGKHKYQTSKGTITASNLSNIPTAKGVGVLLSQGFGVPPV